MAWSLLEIVEVNELRQVLQIAVKCFVLGTLLLFAKEVADVDVENQNDFASGDEGRVERQLYRFEAGLLHEVIEAREVPDHRVIVVVVDEEVDHDVADHALLQLQQDV